MAIRSFFVLLLAMSVTAPVVAQQEATAQQDTARQADISTDRLRPGDVVRLRIWREPDMSGQYIVDEAGSVIFPRVGEYFVLNETPETLTGKLLTDFRQYLVNPSIEITVLRRIRVIGAVNNPGLFLLDPTVTIADALAEAGGATPIGDPDRVRIIRAGETIAADLNAETPIVESPIRSGDQIYVPERSWLARNSGVVAATITGTVSLLIALFIR